MRRDLPQALAGQVFRRDVFVEGLVVAADVLGERVRHDLVHIHTDALHSYSSTDTEGLATLRLGLGFGASGGTTGAIEGSQ